ncbi:MAG: DUF3368 domain-containing protein [Acidobacteria bacterium]|nr:DUF3368 domain-containing protein [Acidobacteriota bacterium]
MIVIADTTPLNCLVLIGEAALLPELYGRIVVPGAVHKELLAAGTPPKVRSWAANRPKWLEVLEAPPGAGSELPGALDPGEREALALAQTLRADLLLIDDQAGRREARRLHLSFTGTLGVLAAAADRGLIDLRVTLGRLERTSFYVSPSVLARLMEHTRR